LIFTTGGALGAAITFDPRVMAKNSDIATAIFLMMIFLGYPGTD
jgi:hypothetical protein